MSGIYEHLESFAGLIVMPWDAKADVSPDKIAWSVGLDPETYWRGGSKGASCAEAVHALAKRPFASQIKAIVVGPWSLEGDVSADEVIEALADHAQVFLSLEAIFFGDIVQEEQEISWIEQGDVTPLLTEYPKLEVLRVRGGNGLRMKPVNHDALRELAFETGGLPREVVQAIAQSKFPALEHLELWLGGFDYERTVELADLEQLWTNARFSSLRYVGLRNAGDSDEIAKQIAKAPILGQLRELDLSMGTIGDEGAEALLASPFLSSLEKLDLAHHFLSDQMQQRLRATGVTLDLSEPGGDDNDERYNTVSE